MKNATEIIVVMDKSGSMNPRATDAIGGFNTLLTEQQAQPGEAFLTLVLFDTTYTFAVPLGTPLKDVVPLTAETYRPGGNTALNDALARAIIETGKRLSDMNEADRPDKVICVVITDGEENSSQEYHGPEGKKLIQEMVKHQEEKYNWAFMYLGTGVDAFAQAAQVGISPAMAANFSGDSQGTRSAYSGTSHAVSDYRSGGKSGLDKSSWKGKIN